MHNIKPSINRLLACIKAIKISGLRNKKVMYSNNNLNFKLYHRPLLLDIFTEHSSRDVSSIMLTANSALKLKMLIWPIYNSMLSEIWCYRSQEYSKVLKWARMHPKYPLRSSQVGLCLRNWQKLSRKLFR